MRAAALSQPWVVLAWFENKGTQFPAADDAGDLSEPEKRQQQNKAHDANGEQTPRIPSKKRRQAFGDGMSVP